MFGKRPSPKERTRAAKREVRQSQRGLQREVKKLEREEAKLIGQIKAAVRKNDKASATQLAKSLNRVRKQKTRMVGASSQLGSVQTRLAQQDATRTTAQSLASASRAMAASNAALPATAVAGVAQQFAQESERMDMRAEMIDDAIDGAMDSLSDDEEVDNVLAQVLDGVALDVTAQLAPTPSSRVGTRTASRLSADEVQAEEDRILAEIGAL